MFVRAGCDEDLAAVVRLERAMAEAPHWPEGEYRAALAGGGGGVRRCLLVAEVEGRLAGFAVGKVVRLGEAAAGELESVVVAQQERRRGVGRALCVAVMRWCGAQGAGGVELEVRAGSGGAIALYQGLGFVPVGRRRRYYRGPVEDALLMGMELRG